MSIKLVIPVTLAKLSLNFIHNPTGIRDECRLQRNRAKFTTQLALMLTLTITLTLTLTLILTLTLLLTLTNPNPKTLRKYCFANRVVEPWNHLPDHIVRASSVSLFRKLIDTVDLSGYCRY